MFFLNSSCDVSLSGFYVSTCETPAVFHQVKAADSLFCFTLDDVISVTLTHTHTLFHNLKLFWTRLWRHQSNCSIVSGTQNGCRLKCKWGELSADRSDWHAAFTWGRETFNIIFKYKTDKAQCENSAHHGSVFQRFHSRLLLLSRTHSQSRSSPRCSWASRSPPGWRWRSVLHRSLSSRTCSSRLSPACLHEHGQTTGGSFIYINSFSRVLNKQYCKCWSVLEEEPPEFLSLLTGCFHEHHGDILLSKGITEWPGGSEFLPSGSPSISASNRCSMFW